MARRLCAAWLGVVLCLLLLTSLGSVSGGPHALADIFLLFEDLPVVVVRGILAGLALALPRQALEFGAGLGGWLERAVRPLLDRTALIALGVGVLAAGWLGARFAVVGFPLSMDEFMARFDAEIFRHGQLMAPVPLFWREFTKALQPMFLLPTAGGRYWASAYLPVNAAFLALAKSPAAMGLVNAAWSALSVIATFAVARRFWPDRPTIALVAALLLATSSQLLVTAMTTYAMPAHLALNMVWLYLFLRGDRAGHAGAAIVGFAACGLHQLVFHPLFAAPFVIQLWFERRWRSAIFYTTVYAASCLFWIFYWDLVLRFLGLTLPPSAVGSPGGFLAEAAGLIGAFNLSDAGLMARNLIRLTTWQNPLTVPLFVLGFAAAVRGKGPARAMALGIPAMIAALWVLLAFQGYGWGYRYLHGALGSLCLIAAWEWDRLCQGLSPTGRQAATGALGGIALGAILCLTPVRLWQAAQWVRPYAEAGAEIAKEPADIVLVDETGIWFGRHLVRNDPYLAMRPVVLDLAFLNRSQIALLCSRYSVALFDRSDAVRDGIHLFSAPAAGWRAQLRALSCRGPGL